MKKVEMIEIVAEESGVNKEDTLKVYETILKVWKRELAKGNNVIVTGFGAFRVGKRNARKGIKPRTGEIIEIAPRNVVTFKPGVPLKSLVNQEK